MIILIFVTGGISAADIVEGTKLYLNPEAWNEYDSSETDRFALFFYISGTSTGAFMDMTLVSGSTDTYEVTSPLGNYTNVIFCRMDGSTTANTWGNVLNQTEDLTYDGSNNIYNITGFQMDGWGIKRSIGTWSSYTPLSVSSDPCVIYTIDPGFELPVGASGAIAQSTVPGWQTTASNGTIEFWRVGNSLGVDPYEGSAFIELMGAGLYQDYNTPDPVVFNLSFAYRGKAGTTICKVSAGPVGGPYKQIMTATDSHTDWGLHQGSYTVPVGQTTTRFLFQHISVGGFLDAITFTATIAPPSVPEDPIEYCVGEIPTVFTDLVTGTNLTWYTSETGGTGSSSVPVISTTTPGTTLTYVTQTINGCESPRALVTVVVNNCASNLMTLTVDGTINTVCNGTAEPPVVDCNYTGPTIVINEIMVWPTTGNGAFFSKNN
ncbi:MAG: hypothetical protein EOL95_06380, partial [Bacteroidia bacterium]|nr:hypothetical protein [Bacteroidia bacterium]